MTCRWVGEMSKFSLRRSQGKVFHNSHNLSSWRATEDSNFKQLIMRCKLKRRHTQKTYQDVSFKVDVFVSLFAFAALSFKSSVVSHLGVVFLPIVSFVQDLKTMISNHVMLVKVNFWYILITFFCKRKKIQFSFLPEGTGLTCVSRTNFDLLVFGRFQLGLIFQGETFLVSSWSMEKCLAWSPRLISYENINRMHLYMNTSRLIFTKDTAGEEI